MNPIDPPIPSNRKTIVVTMAIVTLLAAIAFGTRPAYRLVRATRANRLAAEAEVAIQKQAWPEAQEKAQAAYHLDPTSANVTRVVARLYTIAGHPNAADFWRQLLQSGKATVEDRREFVRAGLRSGRSADVRDEAFHLGNDPAGQPDDVRLAAEFCLLTGDRTNALRFSRALMKLDAGPVSELILAKALLVSGEAAAQSQARAALQRLASGTNSIALDAEVVLARSGLVSDEAMPALIEKISTHPDRRLPHRLLAEELRLRIRPQDRAATVSSFVNEVSGNALTNRIEVARWLNRQREFARTTNLIVAPEAITNRDAFLVRVDALAGLADWKQARAELETENAPIEPVLREVYLARTARELNRTPEAEAHWRRAQLELGAHPEALMYVADYAERVGETDEARKAYDRLASLPEYSDQAYAGLIRIAENNGGTRTLREIMRDLSARRPDDAAPLNDFAYLNLLLNERLDSSKATAQKLYEEKPNVLAFRTTLALAHLRLNEIPEARSMYDGMDLDWSQIKPGWQAVHAAVVAATGQTNLARTLVRQIPAERLKPEEKLLIQPWL